MPFDFDHWMNPDSYGHENPDSELARETNERTCGAMYDIWEKNCEENFPLVSPRMYLSSRFGEWAGENVLVLGAGKTVEKNTDLIRKAWESGWKVICVDRIFPVVRNSGTIPDIVISLDASNRVSHFLDRLRKADTVALCLHQHRLRPGCSDARLNGRPLNAIPFPDDDNLLPFKFHEMSLHFKISPPCFSPVTLR